MSCQANVAHADVNGQDDLSPVEQAFAAKLSSRACPICGRGQFEPLGAEFVVSVSGAAGAEPIAAVGQVCTRCGFLALHSSKHLLEGND
jgi:ribosomal protein S27AE